MAMNIMSLLAILILIGFGLLVVTLIGAAVLLIAYVIFWTIKTIIDIIEE